MKIKFILLLIILLLNCFFIQGLCENNGIFDLALQQNDTVVLIKTTDIAGESYAMGSGVVISEDGIILTNFHVIDKVFGANVTFPNGAIYQAEKVIGYNKDFDMALIKVVASKLKYAKLGDSKSVNVGDYVMAIGNPEGYTSTVSEGIVSGIRNKNGCDEIQISAQITHGSSGGGLFNTKGELIGITSSGYGTGNLNFSSAINQLKTLTDAPVDLSFADFNNKVYGGKKLNEVAKVIRDKYCSNIRLSSRLYFNDISFKQIEQKKIVIKAILLENSFDNFMEMMLDDDIGFSTNYYTLTSVLKEIREYVKVSFPSSKVDIELLSKAYVGYPQYVPYMSDKPRKFDYEGKSLDSTYELPIINIIEFENNKTFTFYNYLFK